MASFPKEALTQLKAFLEVVKVNPTILDTPDLHFFKEFIEFFGGKLPEAKPSPSREKPNEFKNSQPNEVPQPPNVVEESDESDIELDNDGVVEPDVAEPLEAFDELLEVSEENIDKSNEKKRDAIHAYSEGDYKKAVEAYSEAIQLNPSSALLYAKRGQGYLQMNKPNACIRDCTRAITINPDSAAAYKFRGRAHRLLGLWEEAARDLRDACKIDFDEQADEWLREVTPNARKLEEHRRKYERKRSEKDLREKQERIRKAKEEHAKAAAANAAQENLDDSTPLNDPEFLAALSDPEVNEALMDMYKNPTNFMKYQDNPKIQNVIKKLGSKYASMGGMPGGFPQFNFSGAGAPPPSAPANDDVGLD
uniref:STI1 domain-containing protein n=1 Tax=Clastoptera arizonana TaxID=38151 RepID=A0A1B6DCL6_9HEMI